MKKVLPLIIAVAAFTVVGCAGTQSTSTANTPMSLDEALQKSAQTRQQILDAKSSYEAAKNSASSSSSSAASSAAKDAVQAGIDAQKAKLEAQKAKIEAEKQAWKEALK